MDNLVLTYLLSREGVRWYPDNTVVNFLVDPGLATSILWLKLRFFFRSVVKLCQNPFRTIPNISFFDIEKKNRNFERPFTHRGWLHSASNFGKTRFRGSPIFHFSTPKNFLDKNFCRKKNSSNLRKIFQQSACFGGAVKVWTSPSDAHRKFIARHIGFSLLRPCFFPELRPKKTYTFSAPKYDGMSLVWYYDNTLIW